MRTIAVFFMICLILLASCSSKKYDLQDIQGDWMMDCDSIRPSQNLIGFSISENRLSAITNIDIWPRGIVNLNGDTLIIRKYGSNFYKKYLIRKLTPDSLILSIDGKQYYYHNRHLENNNNQRFRRISIRDASSNPYLIINLDSSGMYEVQQRSFGISKKYRLSNQQYKTIDSLFKLSCIEKTVVTGWCKNERAYMFMIFEFNDKIISIGLNQYPIPYRIKEMRQQLFRAMKH